MTEAGGDAATEQPEGELRPKIVVWSPDGTRRAEHALTATRVTIGRAVPGHSPDIALAPDPQSWISRLHCWLELVDGSWYVVDNGERIDIPQLGHNRHKLVRYMASRNAANGGVPVTCTHDELIAAVWGPPETWRFRTAYSAENLRDLVFELRRKLRPHDDLLGTTPGIGYSLHTKTP